MEGFWKDLEGLPHIVRATSDLPPKSYLHQYCRVGMYMYVYVYVYTYMYMYMYMYMYI